MYIFIKVYKKASTLPDATATYDDNEWNPHWATLYSLNPETCSTQSEWSNYT